MRDVAHAGKATHPCLVGLAMKKSGGTLYNNADPKMAAQQFPPLNVLGFTSFQEWM